MLKQTILSVLLIALLASTAVLAASTIFSLTKLFETGGNKRAPNASNLCCFPNVVSFKTTFNQASITPNSTLQVVEGSISFSADYNLGKLRQDISVSIDGGKNVISSSNINIKISSSLTVYYDLRNGQCTCKTISSPDQWQPFCIPNQGSVTKAKIGAYDALSVKIAYGQGVSSIFWAFREPQMANDTCWVLSTYSVVPTYTQEQSFYDMVEKVDPSVFIVPSQCPSINSCLNQ